MKFAEELGDIQCVVILKDGSSNTHGGMVYGEQAGQSLLCLETGFVTKTPIHNALVPWQQSPLYE